MIKTIFFILILKKLPLFYLLKTLFSKTSYTWIFVIRIIIGIFGLFCSAKNFKLFFCWSSVVKSGFIRIIFLKKPILRMGFLFYLLCARFIYLFFEIFQKSRQNFFIKSKSKNFFIKNFFVGISRVPPIFWVFEKVFFL